MARRDREMEREFAEHLARDAAERAATGADPREAQRQAALALGSAERFKEEAREQRRGAGFAALGRDLRYAARGLWRAPGFALAAMLTLGLGIGANTAVFSAVEAVLLAPLPYAQPQRLLYAWEGDNRRAGSMEPFSYPDFLDLRHVPALSGMAAYVVNDIPLTGSGEAAHVRAAAVSASTFGLLGVSPAAGRGFLEGEDRPGSLEGADAAVLSADLARRRFGGSAAALGKRLTLDGRPYIVVGVMPAGFQFPLDDHEDLWVTIAPLQISANGPAMTAQRGAHWMRAVARLAPGASAQAAAAQLNQVADRLAKAHPDSDPRLNVSLVPMLAAYTGSTQPVLLILMGAVGCVLLIACVNVAGLVLARALRRRHEFAVRAALGASRNAVLRQLGCEGLLVGLVGAAVGLAFAGVADRMLVRLAPAGVVRLDQTSLNVPVLLITLGLGLLSAALFALFPALELLRAERSQLAVSLQSGGRGARASRPGWRRGLVSAQFGLAAAVLAAALLLLHSLGRLLSVAPGFSADQVLDATINVPDARYPQPDDDARFFDQLLDRLAAQPSIAIAAAAMPTPLGGNNIGVNVDFLDHPLPEAEQTSCRIGVVSPDYFAALAIPLRAGRAFTRRDRHGSPEVAIVNQAFARKFLPGRAALGVRIRPGFASYPQDGQLDPAREIVGVVGDTRQSALSAPAPPMIYVPQDQIPFDGLDLLVRARPGADAAAAAAVRAAVHGLDPDIPVFDLRPMAALVDASSAPARFDSLLLTIFAALALLLASVGLYAVMAQSVAQRRREIGVRVTLGARRSEITGMVLREGMAMAAGGVGCGLLAAALLARWIGPAVSANLYATSIYDPLAFTAAPLLLLALAALACALPARRAASADPVQALRLE